MTTEDLKILLQDSEELRILKENSKETKLHYYFGGTVGTYGLGVSAGLIL